MFSIRSNDKQFLHDQRDTIERADGECRVSAEGPATTPGTGCIRQSLNCSSIAATEQRCVQTPRPPGTAAAGLWPPFKGQRIDPVTYRRRRAPRG